jgi:predicted DNA-binding transcriptional regulator AlpA
LAATLQSAPVDGYSEKIAQRVKRTLEIFPFLPDDALIELRVVCALRGRSRASIWRDAAQGRLAQPVRVGARSARWRVGDVRAAMKCVEAAG